MNCSSALSRVVYSPLDRAVLNRSLRCLANCSQSARVGAATLLADTS
jgi:deoxyinosine 3'endonuclease (endonuclease V)